MLKKNISILTFSSIFLFISTIILSLYIDSISAILIQLIFVLLHSSITLSGNYITLQNTTHISETSKKLITFVNLGLIIFATLSFFNIIPFLNSWHLVLGLSILYLLVIVLNLLGWSNNSHSFFKKIIFALSLITYVFLSIVFIFKINTAEISPIINISIILSFLFFLIGIYQKKNI